MIQYADDMTEVCPILGDNDPSFDVMQEFQCIENWSISNGFSLNSNKTQCMIIWKKGKERHVNLIIDLNDLLYLNFIKILLKF